ncbi:hypothetical protein H7X46_11380 [Pseudonocardia sp. C8]|uniref:hypothetical protein n=1 Tax=Pseudonocardia sp. C8 TaxID=2762759 RepID=UPI001642C636|nr:hypothetical protein [Pseudonocardia sp. C8]MBC3191662.1 hypothetical protein [Pseudonocardia sp. C8]
MFDKLKRWSERQQAAAQDRLARTDPVRAWVERHKMERIAHLAGVHLFPDRIVRTPSLLADEKAEERPVAGVSASVDNTGGVSGRATLTRTAIPGAHGWQKKVDTRETWLVVDGPDFQWSVQVEQAKASQARAFAAQITTAGRKAAAAE